MSLWWRRCQHLNVRCVHGDEINARWGKRRACLDCGRSLPGPLPEICWHTGARHEGGEVVSIKDFLVEHENLSDTYELWGAIERPEHPFTVGELREIEREWDDALRYVADLTDEVARLREVIADGIEAFRLTKEYVNIPDENGHVLLPDIEGWSHFDWTEHARHVLSEVE